MESAVKKKSPRKIPFRRLKKAPPGAAPGTMSISDDALKPHVRIISYNETSIEDKAFGDVNSIKSHLLAHPTLTHWVEVKGFGDRAFFESMCDAFNIHRLEMEDVLSGHQRPKVEESDHHLFVVSRAITNGEDFLDEQVSLFIFKDVVITFQERQNDYFLPVKDRLQQNRGVIRKSGASYLGYAIMDAIVDDYFPVMERLGNFLDDLEDLLLDAPDRYSLQNIQGSKRRLIQFRRIVWSEREKLNDIMRNPSPLFSDVSRRYLRDTYDHTIQVMDIIDSYREITASLMDIYLSSVSNRLNQVMKVLTIISTIFIPLTFVVGVYGMNFQYDKSTMPFNMPELHSPYGYIGVMLAMVLIVIFQIAYFFKKGWLIWRDRK
ncbi:MAG: magnesium/cobalt transporter CorA [Arcticibacter sp.]